MKQLIVIRHAKSSWAHTALTDFERPLNERGERDAPLMGKRLKAYNIFPDAIIVSEAKRTRQTAKRIAGELNFDKEKIELQKRLYHCETEIFLNVIEKLSNDAATAFIIAHNPGITNFVNSLYELFRIDNMPTCGVVGVRFDGAWKDFHHAEKEVFLFEYPKKL